MIKLNTHLSKSHVVQILLYLFTNGLFILKYFPRAGASSPIILIAYCVFLLVIIYLYNSYFHKVSDKIFKVAFWSLLGLMILGIIGLLIKIDPESVRVDRWSAVSYFLDYLFQGKYPYAAHTHVSVSNFASPFPIWHILNIPFYLLGDVGIGLIFFLLLTCITIQHFFKSYRKSFFFLLLLCIAPAYWWEVAVRSDSLSNAFLVFCLIFWYRKKRLSLSVNFWLTVVICGLISSTRLSAIIPLALFLFKPFIQLRWKQKVIFPLAILGVAVVTFIPFIFWDTENWIFFSRNPFMSQTSVGNPVVLSIMVVAGCIFAINWKSMVQFSNITSIFMFLFILSSQISLIITRGIHGSIFTDSLYDVSYFTLILPYILASLTFNTEQK